MGSCFYTTWKKILGSKDKKILMLGLDGAGKTTILYRFKMGETLKTDLTIGFNLETLEYNNLNFIVWDVTG